MESARRAPVRGEHEVTIALPWRLDGSAPDETAPLVLCLHGMGMDEDRFALLLRRLFDLPFRFLVPRGPYPVEVRGEGRVGASWYAYDGDQDRFRRELRRTETLLLGMLRDVEKNRGLRPRSRFLLGFSQGGYCGSYFAVRHPEIFAGMVVCSARVKTEILEDEILAAGKTGFAALLLHGTRDTSVAPEGAERSRAALEAGGVDVSLRTFDAGHSLGRAQVAATAEWLAARA